MNNKWNYIFDKKKIYIKDINLQKLKQFNFKKISFNLTNEVYHIFTFQKYLKLMDFISKKIELKKKNSLCDFGSGNGGILYYLIRKFDLRKCYSVEISQNYLNFQKKFIPNTKFIKIDFTSIKKLKKIKNQSVDIVIVNSVAQYFYSDDYCKNVLKELFRIASDKLFIYDIKNKKLKNEYISSICKRKKIKIIDYKKLYKKTPLRFYSKDFFSKYCKRNNIKFNIFKLPSFALDNKYGFCLLMKKK
ncbi:class I SAM-dependent methyltransferase [Candidatus Pelagibacter sp.]|nr:class I SAM-dependent methyltransferase [Candidatus Pelagibacter sp.]